MPQTASPTQPTETQDVLVIKASMAAARIAERMPMNANGGDLLNALRLAYLEGGNDMIDMATGVLRQHS